VPASQDIVELPVTSQWRKHPGYFVSDVTFEVRSLLSHINATSLTWLKAENGAVEKGLFWLPVRGDRLLDSQKVASVAHRRRSSQGNQPQNEEAHLIGLPPLDVQSLTGTKYGLRV
jgi:hypothetical protein